MNDAVRRHFIQSWASAWCASETTRGSINCNGRLCCTVPHRALFAQTCNVSNYDEHNLLNRLLRFGSSAVTHLFPSVWSNLQKTNKQTNEQKSFQLFFFLLLLSLFSPPNCFLCVLSCCAHFESISILFKKDVKLLLGLWRWKEIMQLAYFTNPSLLKTSETKNRKHFEESTQYVLFWHDSTLLT